MHSTPLPYYPTPKGVGNPFNSLTGQYTMPTIGKFHSVSQIKSTNASNGRYFFSDQTMKMFACRVHDTLYSGCVFVTSERPPSPYSVTPPRAYTVRIAMEDGGIETYGSYRDYATRAQAHAEAQWLGNALRNGTVAYNPNTYKFETTELLDC